ncbi:TIGR03089 family protein [Plantactinospora sp. GCM10030261]|uniref:TIGR03089 family protein n=1 Tax=Plantactinospora sp. GCM10030261 TaxID=3273420 RepID=UPI003607882E
MDHRSMTADVPALLTDAAVGAADQPLLTYYDDATGERTVLSATQLAGWAARTAGLLHAGCGLDIGARAAVLLPPHWQTAGVILGAWSAGVSVYGRASFLAGLPDVGPGTDEPFDVAFVSRRRLDDWLEDVPAAEHRFVLDLAAPGTPPGVPPAGYRDYLTEARRHPDSLPAYAPIRRDDSATVDGTSYRDWGNLARELADAKGLRGGDRVLVDAAEHENPVYWLLAPLSVGASVVLCANLDTDAVATRVAREQITRVL